MKAVNQAHFPWRLKHCKNSLGINSNYLSLKRNHYTVRNKGNLSGSIVLLKCNEKCKKRCALDKVDIDK